MELVRAGYICPEDSSTQGGAIEGCVLLYEPIKRSLREQAQEVKHGCQPYCPVTKVFHTQKSMGDAVTGNSFTFQKGN